MIGHGGGESMTSQEFVEELSIGALYPHCSKKGE